MFMQARILLVDDESAILATFANTKEEAPESIVNDVIMPMMDGRGLLRSIDRDHSGILSIPFSHVGSAFERVIAIGEGADDVITNALNPAKWSLDSWSFSDRQERENHHSQRPGRLSVAI